ncbi:MAG: hypothetical protein F8N39_01195 [Clostridiaceae bacterium]|nr:hypothetical protein [Clostridiaceae bacterium]
MFKTLVIALDKKRIRQGYGTLYNIKSENCLLTIRSTEKYLVEKQMKNLNQLTNNKDDKEKNIPL